MPPRALNHSLQAEHEATPTSRRAMVSRDRHVTVSKTVVGHWSTEGSNPSPSADGAGKCPVCREMSTGIVTRGARLSAASLPNRGPMAHLALCCGS